MKLLFLILTGLCAASLAQIASPALQLQAAAKVKPPQSESLHAGHRKFVLDVVQSAVAIPQPDPQDRLRVLNAAANIVDPIDPKIAQQFAKEGIRIETELVSQGEKPAVSMLAGGHVDCASALTFVQTIPPSSVVDAEQSLLGAISACPSRVDAAAKAKVEAGLDQGVVAPRVLLALMEGQGMNTAWSQATFVKLFSSLPSDAPAHMTEAPNYAAMFVRGAPEMDTDTVKTAGLKFLDWLGKVPESPYRQVAVNMATDTLSKILGKEAYDELLRSDVMAQQVAATGSQDGVLPAPEEESASVLQAMGNKADRTDELQAMPASLRAREAAASGFASGTSGDRKAADHYFDIAFSALEQVWSDRASLKTNAPDVVEEVSEAAAQVDPVAALQRSQRLSDPSAEAISMLAVARVVEGAD